MGGNLGFDVRFVLDATHTFDLTAPDGSVLEADLLTQVTAANLHGEFATVVQTRERAALGSAAPVMRRASDAGSESVDGVLETQASSMMSR